MTFDAARQNGNPLTSAKMRWRPAAEGDASDGGLLYRKQTYSLSDEAPVGRWVENTYWQVFCGMEYFQHEPPIHASSLGGYRRRPGPAGCEELLRQSYICTAKRMAVQMARYAHAKQFRRMHRELKRLKGRLGRVVRDLERKTASWDVVPKAITRELALAHRLLAQQRTGANKLYSVHAPEVESISKGKAHKRYEFGVKVGVVASLKKPFILAAHVLPGRPYDGHTLMRSLAQATLNTGVKIKTAVADKGYRGHETWPGARIMLPGNAVAHKQNAAGGLPVCAGAA